MRTILLILTLIAALCSCGTPTTPAPAHPALNVTAEATEVLRLVNEIRTQGTLSGQAAGGCVRGGMNSLTRDNGLDVAASGHARYVAEVGFEGHRQNRSDAPQFTGTTTSERINRAGASFFAYGEAVGAGQRSAAQVVREWLDSPGHCAVITDRSMKHIGVGVWSSVSGYQSGWVIVTGR